MATPATLNDLVFRIREISAGRGELLRISRGGRAISVTATDFLREVHALVVALEDAGLVSGERVAIYSENRPEWHVVDLACQLLGASTVPVYARLPPEKVAFVLRNSGARWVFYSDAEKRDVLRGLWSGLTRPPTGVAFDGDAAFDDGTSITRMIGDGARRLGDVPLERFRGRVEGDAIASIAYTGRGGEPRGAMLSHRNMMSTCLGCAETLPITPDDQVVSFLPLSQVLQRTLDHVCFFRGARIHHVPDGRDLSAALTRDRPTVLVAPATVFEAVHRRTLAEIEGYRPRHRRLANWALNVGERYATTSREGFIGPFLAIQRWLAHRLVFRRIHEALGGRLRFAVAGGATVSSDAARFFDAIGLPVYEGYSLTEATSAVTFNTSEQHRIGSLGKPLPNVEVRITEDGEIQVRSPGVMSGYWQQPEATAAAIDETGWLHTGDIGRLDRAGYLYLADSPASESPKESE
ncbi:MAG: AMP-binding protein [Acidobacteriota bacterium]